ncbi:MAG: 30S ribosomal protein S3 [Candidatus Thorarchaeota archaeon]
MSAITHFIRKGVRQAEVDEYLAGELSRAGYGGVEISKTPLGERITIHAARPGIVIGRRGKNIRMITDELVSRYGFENPQIEVKEVENPELNAKVMAYSLVSTIERGVHRRRAAYSVMRRVLNAGAKGCEIIIAGKLTSKRSRHEAYRMGLVAKSGEMGSEYVISATAIAVMKLGAIGVTVNIMRGDIILPDEISLLNIKMDEEVPVEIIQEQVDEKIAEIPKKEPAPEKEKAPKEDKPVKKEEKEISKKKTDLDLEVEELSDLIEKTPGEEVKSQPKKSPAKKEETPAKTPEAKKPSPVTKVEKPAKKDEKVEAAKPKDKKETKPAKDDKKDIKETKDDKKDIKETKDDKKDSKAAKDNKKDVKVDTKKELSDAKEKKTTATKSADKPEKEPSKKKDEKPKKEEEKSSKAKDVKADSKEKAPKKEEAKDSKSKAKSDDKKKKE